MTEATNTGPPSENERASEASSNEWLVVDGLPVHHTDQGGHNFTHAKDVYRLSFQAMGGNDTTNVLTKEKFIS